jgi:hypothetical protein
VVHVIELVCDLKPARETGFEINLHLCQVVSSSQQLSAKNASSASNMLDCKHVCMQLRRENNSDAGRTISHSKISGEVGDRAHTDFTLIHI